MGPCTNAVKGSSNQRRAVAVAREVANIRNSTSDKLFFEKEKRERKDTPLSARRIYGVRTGNPSISGRFSSRSRANNTHTDTDFAAVEGDSEEL